MKNVKNVKMYSTFSDIAGCTVTHPCRMWAKAAEGNRRPIKTSKQYTKDADSTWIVPKAACLQRKSVGK